MFGIKKYTLQEMQLISNIVNAISEDFSDTDNVDYLVSQAIPILKKDEEIKISEMTDNEKIKLKTEILEEINKVMEKYLKLKVRKLSNDKVYLSYNGKDYSSSYINVRTYFYINENIVKMSLSELSENVLNMIFEGILQVDVLEDIKDNEPIYYEILLEDTHNLILKTLSEIMSINTLKRPEYLNKQKSIFDIDLGDSPEISLYSSFLEIYSMSPKEINESKASDILNSLSIMSKKQIVKDAEEYVKDLQTDDVTKKALMFQLQKDLQKGVEK